MSLDNSSGKVVIYQMMTRLFGNKNSTNKTFGTRDENGVGKFNDINDNALEGIKELGVTHIWYTGAIEHALVTDYSTAGIALDDPDVVKGLAGSPYAIKDYYDVNPDLAVNVPNRMKEFEALIERTHRHELKVILDFVPNHVARRYKSDAKPNGIEDLGQRDDTTKAFSAANNFYYLPGEALKTPKGTLQKDNAFALLRDGKFEEHPAKATGNDVFNSSPKIDDWYETVKLNYSVDYLQGHATHFDPVPDTWNKMKEILLFWASKKVDGFRCDMAEMVPVEFWHWVIPQIKLVYPETVFIAEIYNSDQYRNYLEKGRFNYLYDKVKLYDTLRLLVGGERSTADIAEIQSQLSGINDNMLHFMENHDEQRIASKFFAGDPWKAVPAMVISATIDRGAVMIYFGQEVGEPGAGKAGFQSDDGRTTIFDYWGVPEHQKWMSGGKFSGDSLNAEQRQLRQFYSDLLTLCNSNKALAAGKYRDITAYNINAGNFNNKIHAFVRFDGEERLVILTGFNSTDQDVKVQIPKDIVLEMGLDDASNYIARDLLWREIEVGFNNDFTFSLKCKPYSSFIFKMK
ncbi:MAG: alpha-amylase family protein [Chryseolinea sp.]